jgi:hypothetical protein
MAAGEEPGYVSLALSHLTVRNVRRPSRFWVVLQLGTCTLICLTQNEMEAYFSCIFNYL